MACSTAAQNTLGGSDPGPTSVLVDGRLSETLCSAGRSEINAGDGVGFTNAANTGDGAGLTNVANTCYMVSVLQGLACH